MNYLRLHFVVLLSLMLPEVAHAYSVIFLVRHAEKVDESRDPPLNNLGQKRAQDLARLLQESGINAVYTSEFIRTQKTAEPLASQLKIKPVTLPAQDLDKLVAILKADQSQGAALVVGHSNTVPDILQALGSPSKIKIGDNEYDRLFILFPQKNSPALVTTLRY